MHPAKQDQIMKSHIFSSAGAVSPQRAPRDPHVAHAMSGRISFAFHIPLISESHST